MSTWRAEIRNQFIPKLSKLTLVADPDGLLTEEKLSFALREAGFDTITFTDPVEFRYLYESRYRGIWDRGDVTDLVVSLRIQDSAFNDLPYDLLCAGRKLSFSLGALFPNFSYPILVALDRSLLDPLYEAQRTYKPDRLGDNGSADFILRHVFGIAPELINNETELFRMLLKVHDGKQQIPKRLRDRVVALLQVKAAFREWPIALLLADFNAFTGFIQERWDVFVKSHIKGGIAEDAGKAYTLTYDGPVKLPFGHEDIRIYVEKLFVEGQLKPVETGPDLSVPESWMASGILGWDEADTNRLRLEKLFAEAEKSMPQPDARHTDWLTFGMLWAELTALVIKSGAPEDVQKHHEIGAQTDAIFEGWLKKYYSTLINIPPVNPALVHHIPRKIARELEGDTQSAGIVLIVADGLSLDQWIVLREVLRAQAPELIVRESAVFAWIPTLTPVSRQAIFSGKPPVYFPTSIHTTHTEEKLWMQFWAGYGIPRQNVKYKRGLGDENPNEVAEGLSSRRKQTAVGLVVDKVDRIMHGMQLGSAGMHNQVGQWAERGFLSGLVRKLLKNGYKVWMTSDHGNTECVGAGRPSEGVVADVRGERVRIYPSAALRGTAAAPTQHARIWDASGLPDTYYPMLAGHKKAFVREGETIVGHGGASIEEVIVPLIQFELKG